MHLHLYEIGDLDEFFWPFTTWYADSLQCEAIALVYSGTELPILLALAESGPHTKQMGTLLEGLLPLFPRRFYSHLSNGLVGSLSEVFQPQSHGLHYKMALRQPQGLTVWEDPALRSLTPDDRPAVDALYDASYPSNWFDARMLETGQYVGWWQDGQLISIAGVHVYSPHYRVAALGNITTHPLYQGRGLATRTTAHLCRRLLKTVDTIGLNVKADNAAALRCYEKLGFEIVAEYEEFMFEAC